MAAVRVTAASLKEEERGTSIEHYFQQLAFAFKEVCVCVCVCARARARVCVFFISVVRAKLTG